MTCFDFPYWKKIYFQSKRPGKKVKNIYAFPRCPNFSHYLWLFPKFTILTCLWKIVFGILPSQTETTTLFWYRAKSSLQNCAIKGISVGLKKKVPWQYGLAHLFFRKICFRVWIHILKINRFLTIFNLHLSNLKLNKHWQFFSQPADGPVMAQFWSEDFDIEKKLRTRPTTHLCMCDLNMICTYIYSQSKLLTRPYVIRSYYKGQCKDRTFYVRGAGMTFL